LIETRLTTRDYSLVYDHDNCEVQRKDIEDKAPQLKVTLSPDNFWIMLKRIVSNLKRNSDFRIEQKVD